MTTRLLLSMPLAVALALPAHASRIDVASVDASSSYPPEDGVSYEARQLTDGKASTSWVEGDDGGGLGAWVELDLGGEKELTKMKVWAGLWYSSSYWERANRPKELEIKFSDGSTKKVQLSNEMAVQEFDLGKKKSSSVRLQVKQVHGGSTWADTAISEVQLFDTHTDSSVAGTGFEASSQLPDDADGSYVPANVGDGITDTMWCEGSKDGDGSGEWISVDFGGTKTVSKVSLVNGIGSSIKYWMKGNRATTANLEFSDGSTESIEVKNTMLPQTIEFPAHETSSVKITFTGIAKGKEYNDLCISEATFSK